MSQDTVQLAQPTRVAVVQLIGLGLLLVMFFRHLLYDMVYAGLTNQENAHALAAPVLIGLLIWRRRSVLAETRDGANAWGLLLVGAGLAMYASSIWPFSYAYIRRLTIVVITAGIVLSAVGWRVLWRVGPMLLMMLIAIYVPVRIYAFLIIKIETVTLEIVQALLELIPGVFVELNGLDLSYFGSHGTGFVALGEPFRGASLMLASALIGIFVTFARIRPWPHLAVIGLLAVPVVLAVNVFRLLIWGVVTILGGADAQSTIPRTIAVMTSLIGAYILFSVIALTLTLLSKPGTRVAADPAAAGMEADPS